MGPKALTSCLSLLLLTFAGAAAQKAVEKPTFRTNVKMVLVPVTVTDRSGKTVDGLQADDFNVFDDQKSQKIVTFSSDDAPCSVGVVLDISGSMRPTLGQIKDIVHAFVAAANPDDEFLLLTVSTEPGAITGFTTDTARLEESISFAQPGGQTALIDTIYLGLNRMRGAEWPRRALLILSDGKDNHSRYSQSELMRMALEADVQIYSVIVDTGPDFVSTHSVPYRPNMAAKPWDRAAEHQGPEMLEKLSDQTGGLHFQAVTSAETKEVVIKVARALRNEYLIGYHPPDSGTSERWHRIRVKLNAKDIHVHARKGYYSP